MQQPGEANTLSPASPVDYKMQPCDGDDGLSGMGAACRLVQDVEAGRVASPAVATAKPVAKNIEVDGQRISADGTLDGAGAPASASGDFRPSFVEPSIGSALAPKETPLIISPFQDPRRSVNSPKEQQPPLRSGTTGEAPASARVFKQAPAHDEHQETAASVIFTPKQTYDHIVATGVAKTKLTLGKQITQGVLAGFYISFSFMLCMTVGGQIPTIQHEHPGLYNFLLGSVGFPLGLTVIMVVGADLFTSSCMYMITAWLEGRVATYYVIKNWVVAWFSNLCGCLIMAQLVVWAGLFAPPKNEFPIYLAHKKTSATFGATVCKGILCNWLVNLAVWMANSARDVTGKAVGVYLPVSAFVTLGTEHVVANQFELSLAKMLGSGMSLRTIICSNWIPACIGNVIGGAFFVGTLYAGCYGTLYERIWLRFTQIYIFCVPKRTRERIDAMQKALYDKLFGWIDWDAITAPPAPLDLTAATTADGKPAGATAAAEGAAAATAAAQPVSRHVSNAGGVARAVSSLLAETPKMVAAAFRNPPMTPFERKRTSAGLGSDVV